MMSEGVSESDKSKMSRWQIGNGSLSVLEQVYTLDPFPGLDARRELAKQLNVSPRQVQVWFQNKRQRERKISRAKGQLSTPGLPDTPAAQAAQAAHMGGAMRGDVGAAGHLLDPLSAQPHQLGNASGAPFAALTAQGGSSGGAAGLGLLGKAPAAVSQRPHDFLFGLPMTRACSNPAGFGLDGAGTQLMEDDGGPAPPRLPHPPPTLPLTLNRNRNPHPLTLSPSPRAGGEAEKAALYRLGISPHISAQPDRSLVEADTTALDRLSPLATDRTGRPLAAGLPMARSMSLDSSLLGGAPLLGGASCPLAPLAPPPSRLANYGPADLTAA